MVTIRKEGKRFLLRVAGIIFNQDKSKVLLHRTISRDSWILPGGRVEMGEDALTGIKRELIEELGIKEEVKLKYIAESFYAHNNINHHELGFFYEVIIDPIKYNLDIEDEFLGLEEDDQIFKWVSLNDLNKYVFTPNYLKEMILNIPDDYKYIVVDEITSENV